MDDPMTVDNLVARLARRGVRFSSTSGQVRYSGAVTAEEHEVLARDKEATAATIAALGPRGIAAKAEVVSAPVDPRARAAWLGRLARLAGIAVAGLFRLVDDTIGVRPLGPFALTAAEMDKIAVLIRAEVGTRPPIVEPQVVGGAGADMDGDAIPRSIELMKKRGWSDQQFSALCRRVLGRPGLRSIADDQEVHAVMLREGGNAR